MRAFLSLLNRFRRDRSGNIAMIFSIAVLPVLYSVGCAVDYSRATQLRSKLQASSDAASVGSVAKDSPGFIAAGSMTTDGSIAAGVTDATNIFNANMNGVTGYTLGALTATMTKASNVITSSVQFTATQPTMFLGLMGRTSITVTGTSTSTTNMPLYIDFYLLLDNSPSMGVGATPADVRPNGSTTPPTSAPSPATTTITGTTTTILRKTLGVTTGSMCCVPRPNR